MTNYESFFGLKENPFRSSPDTEYYYPSNIHNLALKNLLYAIQSENGFILISGEPGTGKTLLLRTLISQLESYSHISFIMDPTIQHDDLLRMILSDLGLDKNLLKLISIEDCLRFAKEHLITLKNQGIVPIVIIDEAHLLSSNALNNLSLLYDLKLENQKLITIMLAGQLELERRFKSPELWSLYQKISIKYRLTPLSKHDFIAYVKHRLSIAGGDQIYISPNILKTIFKQSYGIPRMINIICDRTLMIASSEEANAIKNRHVDQAVSSIKIERVRSDFSLKQQIAIIIAGLFLYCVAIGVGYFFIHKNFSWFTDKKIQESLQSNVNDNEQQLTQQATPDPLTLTQIEVLSNEQSSILALENNAQSISTTMDKLKHTTNEDELAIPQEITAQSSSVNPMAYTPALLAESSQDMTDHEIIAQDITPTTTQSWYSSLKNTFSGFFFNKSKKQPMDEKNTTSENQSVLSDNPSSLTDHVIEDTQNEVHEAIVSVPDKKTSQPETPSTTNLEPQKKATRNENMCPSQLIYLPSGNFCLSIQPELKKGLLWQQVREMLTIQAEFTVNWPFSYGIYFIGMKKDNSLFLFNPSPFSMRMNQWMAKQLWENIKSIVAGQTIVPIVVCPPGLTIPEKQHPINSLSSKIISTIYQWKDAWQSENIDLYMNFYSKEAIVYYGIDREPEILSWDNQFQKKKFLFSKTDYIKVRISEPICLLDPINPSTVIAFFYQHYSSSIYSDKGIKVLYLNKNTEKTINEKSNKWVITERLWIEQ